jgi:hypothetical protein
MLSGRSFTATVSICILATMLTGCMTTRIEAAKDAATGIGNNESIVILSSSYHVAKPAEDAFIECVTDTAQSGGSLYRLDSGQNRGSQQQRRSRMRRRTYRRRMLWSRVVGQYFHLRGRSMGSAGRGRCRESNRKCQRHLDGSSADRAPTLYRQNPGSGLQGHGTPIAKFHRGIKPDRYPSVMPGQTCFSKPRSETRRKYIHVGSSAASLRPTVSKRGFLHHVRLRDWLVNDRPPAAKV